MRSCILAAVFSVVLGRSTVSIDLGWRFYRGVPTVPGPCETPFNTNYTGQQCDGLAFAGTAITQDECAAACCGDLDCQIWQWNPVDPTSGGGCWIGAIPAGGCNPDPAWTSYANASRAPGNVPVWALANFSDATWAVVDSPHDFIITGPNASQSPFVETADQGQAFIPKTVGVYRKHFLVPSSWVGTHVELYLEGMCELLRLKLPLARTTQRPRSLQMRLQHTISMALYSARTASATRARSSALTTQLEGFCTETAT
jgi:hypothetical protein